MRFRNLEEMYLHNEVGGFNVLPRLTSCVEAAAPSPTSTFAVLQNGGEAPCVAKSSVSVTPQVVGVRHVR
jgi:hypothetical protein